MVAKNKKRGIEISFSRPDNLLYKRKIKKRLVIFLFIIFTISLGLSTYFGVLENNKDNTSAILKIDTASEIVSGEEVVYKIFYQNIDETDLTKLSLSLTYPRGFTYESSSVEPLNEGQNYWEINDLLPGFASNIEVRGRIIGDIGDQKTIKAVFAYEPYNFSSTFTQEAYFTQEISDLKVDMWVDYPKEAISAGQIQFKVHILNKQTITWQPLILSFNKPDQFSVLATDPGSTIAEYQWEIVNLEPEEEAVIIIMGELASGLDSGNLLFSVDLLEKIDGNKKLLDTNDLPIEIINPNLSISLTFADDESAIVDWGEIVNYELVIKNEGEYIPADMQLVLAFDTNFINWQSWQDTVGLTKDNNKIIWTKDHPKIGSKLASLKQGEEIRLKVGAKLQSEPIDATTLTDGQLLISAVAKVMTNIGNEQFITASDILRTRIGQSFDFVAQAKYYDNDGHAIGSGPLPPAVSKTTIYNIEWNLSTGLDNYTDIALQTTLPPYIIWVNKQVGYLASFNSSKKELLISSTALNAGEKLSGNFNISIIPDKSQIGQILTLLNPMTLTATNKSTGEKIIKQIDMIDTNLIYDNFAQNMARVVE